MDVAKPVACWLGAAATLALAACSPQIESASPLFESATESLRPGLWAFMEEECEPPNHARLFDWPACAMPVRIGADELTVIWPRPIRARFLLADGTPLIAQARLGERDVTGRASPEGFAYYAFAPVGPPPYAAGEVRILRCPDPDELPIPGLVEEDEAEAARCEATSADAVREAARRSAVKRPNWRAVWIAGSP